MRFLSLTTLDTVLLVVAVLALGILGFRLCRAHREPVQQNSGLDLAVVIDSLRSSLERVDKERLDNNRAPSLIVKDAEVEVSFVLKHTAGATAEAKFQVLTVGGSEQVAREEVHRLKVSFKPPAPRTGRTPPSDGGE